MSIPIRRGRLASDCLRSTIGLVVGLALPFLCAADQQRLGLTLEQRVTARRAVEQVYWRHRIWPADNPGPKPDLAVVLPDTAIRSGVEAMLRKSNALEKFWHRPITPAQLQAELDRMAQRTQNAGMLRELFAALGDDPHRIAETLARETLADRLLREWYAGDPRFHGALKRQATVAIDACSRIDCMSSLGGEYVETTWRRGTRPRHDGSIGLEPGEWDALLDRLAESVGGRSEALATHTMSAIEESAGAFAVTAVLSQEQDVVRTASVTWKKVPFDDWWRSESPALTARTDDADFAYSLPALDLAACTPDSWKPTNVNLPPLKRTQATAVWTGAEMIVWGGNVQGNVIPGWGTGGRYDPAMNVWTPVNDAGAPLARSWHSAVWTGTRMIVWGGVTHFSGSGSNDGGLYDPIADRWSPTSTGANVPGPRFGQSAVWTGTQMIVWGGVNGGQTGGRYDPASDTWAPTPTAGAPSPRSGHAAVWTGSRMIVWGGTGDVTGAWYEPASDSWSPTSTGANVPAARSSFTAVWTGTWMIVWGGVLASGPNVLSNSGARYDPSTDAWTPTSTGPNVPPARGSHTAVWTGTEMIVWGGVSYDGTAYFELNTGGRYNPGTDAWTATAGDAINPVPRSLHVAVWTGNEMIVWGGSSNSQALATGSRYVPTTETWTPTSTGASVPFPRYGHTAVWTGAEMIVWGGSVSPSYPPQPMGGRYDPATDSWQTTSDVNAPSARSGHATVWTGTKMIVWGGGGGGSTYPNTGGRFDPATNSWTPTSTGANVPPGRIFHTAVWSGAQMIVWGGLTEHCELVCGFDCCYDIYNSGGRYNPSTDAWLPVSTGAGVPPRRYLHSAVWAGNRMIVWGGADYANSIETYTNSGGRYDPTTDTWAATSTGANVPEPRVSHAAVSTGTQMVLWGGYQGFSDLDSGARYDPGADTWVPTASFPNVPEPRALPAAVWNGTDLIVWGGTSYDGTYLDTGGQYSAAGTWTPTSTLHAPNPRTRHTAVWDGSAMIVWGGFSSNGGLATGGRYCPCLNTLSYGDGDNDGYGDPADVVASCDGTIPPSYVANHDDCNPAADWIHPGATENCNGIDDDCDGTTDDVIPPAPVDGVRMTGATTLEWFPPGTAQTYDVVYGDLGTLAPGNGDFTAATRGCLADGTAATDATVGVTPAVGSGIWILVRGNNCGGAGSYDGEPGQSGPRDAEIEASAFACP